MNVGHVVREAVTVKNSKFSKKKIVQNYFAGYLDQVSMDFSLWYSFFEGIPAPIKISFCYHKSIDICKCHDKKSVQKLGIFQATVGEFIFLNHY